MADVTAQEKVLPASAGVDLHSAPTTGHAQVIIGMCLSAFLWRKSLRQLFSPNDSCMAAKRLQKHIAQNLYCQMAESFLVRATREVSSTLPIASAI